MTIRADEETVKEPLDELGIARAMAAGDLD